jgi:hypothetical protein
MGDRIRGLKRKGEEIAFWEQGIFIGFKEMHFECLALLKSTLDISDYEFKMRPVTMIGCLIPGMFICVSTGEK